MLFFRGEHKMQQKLRCCKVLSITHINNFCNTFYYINNFSLLIKLQTILTIIAKVYGFTYFKKSAIGHQFTEQHFYECGFAGSIISNNSHLFITGKEVIEVFRNLNIIKALTYIFSFKNLFTNICTFCRKLNIAIVSFLVCLLFE